MESSKPMGESDEPEITIPAELSTATDPDSNEELSSELAQVRSFALACPQILLLQLATIENLVHSLPQRLQALSSEYLLFWI
jgi:hypothetical protein